MDREYKSYFNIFITGCLWGTIGLFVKLMEAQGSSSSYTGFLRLFYGAVLLIIITLLREGPKAFRIGRKTLISCILLGVICQGLFNIFYSMSVSMNGLSAGSVLLYTAPVFTCIASMIVFGERLSSLKWLALLVNIIGCALTATGGSISADSLAPLGILVGVGAGLTYGMTSVIGKIALKEKESPFAVASFNLLFGCIFIALVRRPWTAVEQPLDPRLQLFGLLYGLVPTALAYIFYFSGLKRIKQASKVPVIASVELIVATVIGCLAFAEPLSAVKVIGIVLVLLSILLFSR